ncbi:ribosome biogenesis GTPase Der [Bacteroidota bacterium]
MANIMAIVGRPNVGKSTLFNRLVEKKEAIMDNESGVTRDRHYGYAEWTGHYFTVIDTGGYVTGSDDVFEEAIRKQVDTAMDEASVILLMLDCKDGLTDLDKDFARVIRPLKKKVHVVANKADNPDLLLSANEFYELGLGEIYPISSTSGSGTGELLDEVVKGFDKEVEIEEETPKIAIVGRPNVGKSSLLNLLVGQNRSIVTDIAGTTRDTIHTRYNLYGKDFILTDTAGVRKKSRVRENIEFYSVMRSIRAIQDSDICMILIDAEQGLESQDVNLISLAVRYKKGIVILINKWDLIEKNTNTASKFNKEMKEKLGSLNYIPIVFVSVLKKQRIFKSVEIVLEVYENRQQKILTSELNNAILPEIEKIPPPANKGKYIKIKYITQLPTKTPTIAFFCNHPKYIKPPYERFLENKIREQFNFTGVPIKLVFRNK